MNREIWTFWTGSNEMPENRKLCLDSIQRNSGVKINLVTPNNLSDFFFSSSPIHPAYEYLSSVHKSDYLRTYFMHHYGGGYTDIKFTNASWIPFFDILEKSECFGIGYKEIGPNGVAILPDPLGSFLRANWHKLLGNGAYIWKPNTVFTTKWFNALHLILDMKLDLLRQRPAQGHRDSLDLRNPNSYPLKWSEILGDIFHPLCWVYRDQILQGLTPPSFEGYK